MSVEQEDVDQLKAFAIEMSRDPREGLTARQRALMACIVIPAPIQQWMLDAGAVEPLLDSIEKTTLAAEAALRAQLEQIAVVCTDNMDANCNHRMALDFVRQIANQAQPIAGEGTANGRHQALV